MTPREILNRIAEWDPDGHDFGEEGPSTNDYLAFESAVRAEYGQQALTDYYQNNWAKGAGTYE